MKAWLVGIALLLASCSDDHRPPSCEQADCLGCTPAGDCPDGLLCDLAVDMCVATASTADAALPIPDAGAARD